jgi:hypothetical protein
VTCSSSGSAARAFPSRGLTIGWRLPPLTGSSSVPMADTRLQPARPAGRPEEMSTFLRRAGRLAWTGLASIGLGLSVLLLYAWVEVVNNPGIRLVDGYWIGRVPWTPTGVVLVIAGSLLALVAGTAIVVVRGDWLRRFLLLPIFALPALWWAVALGALPFPRFHPPDPVTFAYSLPETAVLALVLPALAAAALALAPIQPDGRIRFGRIRGPRRPESEE